MKRRGFLGWLGKGVGTVGAAAVAPTVTAQILTGPRAANATGFGTGTGFGLAPIKKEGGSYLIDANFSKALYPGVKKWWKEAYS